MTERIKSWVDSDVARLLSRALVIFVFPWGVWMTKHSFDTAAFMRQGDRFSKEDGYALERRFDARIDSLPPQDWRDRIKVLESDLRDLRMSQRMWIDEMSREFMRKDEHPDRQ